MYQKLIIIIMESNQIIIKIIIIFQMLIFKIRIILKIKIK